MSKISKLVRGIWLGVTIAVLGVLLSLIPAVLALEEEWGLDWMFNLRGPRPAPQEVVVVSIDQESSRQLGLDERPNQWSRSVHAQLVNRLSSFGAKVIVFDVFFRHERELQSDLEFAAALKNAGNVILFAHLNQRPVAIPNQIGGSKTVLMDQLVPPVAVIADSVLAYAPFPLPKVPARVNQAWLFKPSSGDIPTLPVLALHHYATSAFQQIQRQVGNLTVVQGQGIEEPDEAYDIESFSQRVRRIRQKVRNENYSFAKPIADDLGLMHGPGRYFNVLAALHHGPDNHYIDFYGPPQSIKTVPYYRVIKPHDPDILSAPGIEFRDKAVFVGNSELYQPDLKDDFHTVFSSDDGFDLSGVEIIATVFANLLEGRSIKPVDRILSLSLMAVWGLSVGLAFYLMPSIAAVLSAVALIAVYLAIAAAGFKSNGHWAPIVIPLLFQLPLALFSALLLRYLLSHRERQRIQKTARYFLPGEVVDSLPDWKQEDLVDAGRVVEGVCLASDAESYASFAENIEPRELKNRLNRYFELLFYPVRDRGGVILDVVGDAMLAFWERTPDSEDTKLLACQAALEIQSKLSGANAQSVEDAVLPTRIGLHCGEMMIGNVGAGDHFEFRAVGDMINTTSRIEGLNKYLGTRVLASARVANQIEGLMITRRAGKFRLKGKDKPLEIFELVGVPEDIDAKFLDLRVTFLDGLEKFESGFWTEAKSIFEILVEKYGIDGPSLFYLRLCDHYLQHGSPVSWDGVNTLAVK